MNYQQFYNELKEDVFYEYDSDEVFGRDAVEFHLMSYDHTEVLGQFIDRTGMSAEELKDCLLKGWIKYYNLISREKE